MTEHRWARSVTTLLHVGPGDMKMPHERVDSADEAYFLMRAGIVVVVPDDDVAREVLTLFEVSEDRIEYQIQMSYPMVPAA